MTNKNNLDTTTDANFAPNHVALFITIHIIKVQATISIGIKKISSKASLGVCFKNIIRFSARFVGLGFYLLYFKTQKQSRTRRNKGAMAPHPPIHNQSREFHKKISGRSEHQLMIFHFQAHRFLESGFMSFLQEE